MLNFIMPDNTFFVPRKDFLRDFADEILFDSEKKKYKIWYDLGCGNGHFLAQMKKLTGICGKGVEMLERERWEYSDIIFNDATVLAYQKDCVLTVCRPCHSFAFFPVIAEKFADNHELYYIGLERNFEQDLDGINHEIVWKNVGEEFECLIRITGK